MPSLTVFIPAPDEWDESVFTKDGTVSHRLRATGKLAPFRSKIKPEQDGSDAVQIDFVTGQLDQRPHLGYSDYVGGAFGWVPVDIAALTWIKEHWTLGRRVQVTFHGENVPGFTLGLSPDGSDVIWDQDVAQFVKLDSVALEVSAFKAGTDLQASDAPIPETPMPPELRANFSKITTRLDWLVGVATIFAAYYWWHK